MNILKKIYLYVMSAMLMLFLFYPLARADNNATASVPSRNNIQQKKAGKNKDPQVIISEISQSLLQMRLKEGVTIEAAAQAMISKAASLNFKLVTRHQMSAELNSKGIKTPHLEMFQFCNVENAGELVSKNRIYAAYIPCQISITDDGKGNTWLMMRNMDMTIDNEMIPPELAEVAIRINQAMLAVITAGATGEF